jgi:hypothetical protein
MAKRGFCPGCGASMKVTHKHCSECRGRSPLFPLRRGRPRTAAVKSAGSGGPVPASVYALGTFRRSPLGAEFYSQVDPDAREIIARQITGGAA